MKQDNIYVLGAVSNETSLQGNTISNQEGDAGELTVTARSIGKPPSYKRVGVFPT
jgi:hypothetical protein